MTTIPNNIGLRDSDPLARQLGAYQQQFRRWWALRGPGEFLDQPMQLRRPTGQVHGNSWAEYSTITPNQYCWGLYTAPTGHEAIAFGEHRGAALWESVPSEYRVLLIEHIRVQGDVENAAIEQSRTLTGSVPSRFELNNLFQFYLEEGRHTWAMVHLLIAYFGHEGTVEAEALLERLSGDAQQPRLLDAFNLQTDDWLSHFMWCFLADRVGKYQIQAVTQCAFAPLARSAKFMMFEEPLHIGFGAAGLERVLCRSAEATLRADSHELADAGAIGLPVFQKYLNFWVSRIFDLFGNDSSQRAHELYQGGIRVARHFSEYQDRPVTLDVRAGAGLRQEQVAPEWAMNAIMRRQYIAEVAKLVERWNVQLARLAIDVTLSLPHERFNRAFGPCKGLLYDVDGTALGAGGAEQVAARLPSQAEMEQVRALMRRELGPDRYASWIAPAGCTLKAMADAFVADHSPKSGPR
ncbi:MAG TPA: benzoyl-CoA 2,3-epoxidase subunit BoxB [Duganella sp.]|nr:benzoyl-CoA 2,3-epoxidase subunit BoxB [Duganella sp.]